MKKCKRADGIYTKRVRIFFIKVQYKKRCGKGVKNNVKESNYNKMEYCLGNGLKLFSASKVFAVCHDSSVFRMR